MGNNWKHGIFLYCLITFIVVSSYQTWFLLRVLSWLLLTLFSFLYYSPAPQSFFHYCFYDNWAKSTQGASGHHEIILWSWLVSPLSSRFSTANFYDIYDAYYISVIDHFQNNPLASPSQLTSRLCPPPWRSPRLVPSRPPPSPSASALGSRDKRRPRRSARAPTSSAAWSACWKQGREGTWQRGFPNYISINAYIYIYIFTHTHTISYISIYIIYKTWMKEY